mmetsp:Transcript_42048/g.65753  ORF Transcript_42048/g.65753 Transcript_42048/m.65753 type:complete len:221 (+) Transcript_42048:220-882(+)
MAVVHKPPGVCTFAPPGSGGLEGRQSMKCAISYFVAGAPEGSIGAFWRPKLVHRLDKGTEGLQVVAKTRHAFKHISNQFANREVKKRYVAVVEGRVDGEGGTVEIKIDEKDAVSDWTVIERSQAAEYGGNHLTTLELCPHHGRTHQLRIHCYQGLGCSIVGDRRYRAKACDAGMLLAAVGIKLNHPETQDILEINIPEPSRFVDFKTAQAELAEKTRHEV